MRTEHVVRVILVAGVLFFIMHTIGCAKVKYKTAQTCKVTKLSNVTEINCNGSKQYIEDGANGIDGLDGSNGTNAILRVYDPCGDGPGADEVILELDGNVFIAWYLNLGLSILTHNVTYQTTDAQNCRFKIQGNTLVEVL